MKNKILTIIAILLAFLAGGEFVYIFTLSSNSESINNSDNDSMVYNSCSNCMSGTMIVENGGISQTVNKAIDSVVMVKSYSGNRLIGSGSGFVYKKDSKYGYIMTNQHVVEGAKKSTVVFTSGKEVEATILGGDKYIDIAVMQVPVSDIISVAEIGKSDDVKLGDSVVAIGTPVGEAYYNTVTGGYISGLDRKITVSVETNNDWVQDVIQIDASINPGNSGGPLVNINGEVIGVNSLKLVDSKIEGMGFAIKIDDAMKHVDKLEKGEKIERPLFGISHTSVTEKATLSKYGITLDESIIDGVVIVSVEKGSSADKAGLKTGDVITKIDDNKVTDTAYLRYVLYKHNVGDKISVTYIRGTSEHKTEVTLTDKVK